MTVTPNGENAGSQRKLRTSSKRQTLASKRKAPTSLVREKEQVSGANTVDDGSSRVPKQKNIDDSARSAVLEDKTMGFWSKKLIEREWYHGVMPREECNELLTVDGDFLVRKTTEKSKPFFCLTVLFKQEPRHFPLFFENGGWTLKRLENPQKFGHLVELLNWMVSTKYQLAPTTAILVRAVRQAKFYIQHEEIELVNKLGEGAFGQVWRGKLKKKGEEPIDVAVKKMKGNPKKSMLRGFVKEAKLMRTLSHPNMVRVIGVAPMDEPLMIVIELAKNGCLQSHLRKEKVSPIEKLTGFAVDTARGMAYLSSTMIIHRDLAARNLLLGANMEVKISDFGLSESGKTEVKAAKIKVPIRWLAPETIDTAIFTTKTDVWSFAVTMWEIFTNCITDPFPGITNGQAKDIIRQKHPPLEVPCTNPANTEAIKKINSIMTECFSKNPEQRPTFWEILKKLAPEENAEQYSKVVPLVDLSEKHGKSRKTRRGKAPPGLAVENVEKTAEVEKKIDDGNQGVGNIGVGVDGGGGGQENMNMNGNNGM
ncbi:unnamed protein product [Caenorhabditis angaria]|uniref:Tyrosine-protein kinase n=1 Tax=Caenorhabditis angaria TaxID=860376 RepID=A0A9P1I817_9PELO|nr:unnamed protein product [Caenorhabditis angaria]